MLFFVSVTRLRLKRPWNLPAFLWFSLRSIIQARNSKGNMDVQTLKDRGLVFWTMTLWRTEEDMRAFRNSGASFEGHAADFALVRRVGLCPLVAGAGRAAVVGRGLGTAGEGWRLHTAGKAVPGSSGEEHPAAAGHLMAREGD